ncbi:MAG: hypothetical protein GYB64_16115 [Chloroflexi bacterium]|nr:hypothetical protein [Chloroflexota bacterium]
MEWTNVLKGRFSSDVYSTAWVAMVPDRFNSARPQWPAALDYLRRSQLPDGGWGAGEVYYAHDRTISTMAAVLALSRCGHDTADTTYIYNGLHALRGYAADLASEPHEPIGFELLLPHLRNLLIPAYGDMLPLEQWRRVDAAGEEKLRLLKSLTPYAGQPQSWWVNMEMLDEGHLAALGREFLDENGAIAASTAATAAFLRAKRLHGAESEPAAAYLAALVEADDGGVPFCWPAEIFESVWGIDSLMRANENPGDAAYAGVMETIERTWQRDPQGLSFSATFPVNDGDDTLVGYRLLRQSGRKPDPAIIEQFWQGDHFCAYTNERGSSNSVNVHALEALFNEGGEPDPKATSTLRWLQSQLNDDDLLDDKWHISPLYTAAHAVPAFAGMSAELGMERATILLAHQRQDGGWGWLGRSTLEETAHVVLALYQAHERRLVDALPALRHAALFFLERRHEHPQERLWIGKTLYRPDGIVTATLYAAQLALGKLGLPHTDLRGSA